MSLNGLDNPDVQNAYQAAIAEAGGWLLLKYKSRDSVELLGQGKNGVSEARNAISEYKEASPLYGLLVYRRRKILIKYIPDGTSRLLQARTSVHFQDVLERYSPYETLLEISTADGLNDTSLAASFQLHTALTSPSISSRLDEIQEDGEDGGAGAAQNADATEASSTVQKSKPDKKTDHLKKRAERAARASLSHASARGGEYTLPAARATSPLKESMSEYLVPEEDESATSATPNIPPPPAVASPSRTITESEASNPARGSSSLSSTSLQTTAYTSNTEAVASSAAPTFLRYGVDGAVPQPKDTPRSPETDISAQTQKDLPKSPSEESSAPVDRTSTLGERPVRQSMEDDPYDLRKYDEWFKPKVKLAPRPVNSPDKIRPAVARVSALPANFKPAAKKQEPARPKSSGYGALATETATAPATYIPTGFSAGLTPFHPPPIPDTPEYKARPMSRSGGGGGSTKSAVSTKSTMTPDKIRLMKAIELRKKQLRKSQEQQPAKPSTDEAPEVPQVPAIPERNPLRRTESTQGKDVEASTDDESQPLSTKADSGIEFRSDKEDSQDEEALNEAAKQTPVSPRFDSPVANLPQARPAELPPLSIPDTHVKEPEVVEQSETATSEQQADEISSGESYTTERPPMATNSSGDSVNVPRIVMSDGSQFLDLEETQRDNIEPNDHNETDSGNIDNEESPASSRRQSTVARRRQGYVAPMRPESFSGNPDDFMSDDDDLLDELHSAIVEEATPVTMARSPLLPTRRPSAETITGSVRSINIQKSPTLDGHLSPDGSFAALPSSPTPPPDKIDPASNLARNVSSGISRRIQALEAAGYSNSQARPLTPDTPPSGFQESREKRPATKRPTSFRRHSNNRASQLTPISPINQTNDPTTNWTIQHDSATNRNSVSVTARIVRPSDNVEPRSDAGLVQQHQEAAAPVPTTRPELPHLNTSSTVQTVQSSESTQTNSPVQSQKSGSVRTLHSATSRFGRHKKSVPPVLDDFPPPPPAVPASLSPPNDENMSSKEGGRTSRFFKRMSSMPFGKGRRNSASTGQSQSSTTATATSNDTITLPNAISNRLSVAGEKDTPPAVVVGDLNVQFPDSLLWKRRIVTIDDSGNLQFAIAQAMDIHKGVALKQFPLVDFKCPYAPDLDSQELSYSIVMEFHDGTSLQAACEDAMTQRQVLYLIKTYWKAWAV